MRCKPSALVLVLALAGCSQSHYSHRLPGGYQGQFIAGRAALKEGDAERGAELLAAAARSEHPYAEIEYARALAFGQGVEEDRAEAIRLLESAYAKSSPRKADAAFYLGRFLLEEQPARALELAVLVAAGLVATVTRYVAMRTWVFARRRRRRAPADTAREELA